MDIINQEHFKTQLITAITQHEFKVIHVTKLEGCSDYMFHIMLIDGTTHSHVINDRVKALEFLTSVVKRFTTSKDKNASDMLDFISTNYVEIFAVTVDRRKKNKVLLYIESESEGVMAQFTFTKDKSAIMVDLAGLLAIDCFDPTLN